MTLIELVVAISISTVIALAVASLTYQLVKVNAKNTNHQSAVSSAQNAINSLTRDTEQAQNLIPKSFSGSLIPVNGSSEIVFDLKGAGDKLELKWVSWEDNVAHDVTYTVTNRTLKKDNLVIATNVEAASGNWSTYTRKLTFVLQIKAGAPGSESIENRTIQIVPRSAQ
jgi:type II secretory pathway pseudopilin PulG